MPIATMQNSTVPATICFVTRFSFLSGSTSFFISCLLYTSGASGGSDGSTSDAPQQEEQKKPLDLSGEWKQVNSKSEDLSLIHI